MLRCGFAGIAVGLFYQEYKQSAKAALFNLQSVHKYLNAVDMDVSMPLRSEIRNIQNQLKMAIQSHQIIAVKVKEQPLLPELKVQMLSIQKNIISLGVKQKKLIQELRKEMEANSINSPVEKRLLCPNTDLEESSSKPLLSIKPVLRVETETVVKPDEDNVTITAIQIPVKEVPEVRPKKEETKSEPVLITLSDTPPKNGISRSPSTSPLLKKNAHTLLSSPSHACEAKPRSHRSRHNGSCPSASGSDESQDATPFDAEVRRKLQFMTAIGLVTRQVLTELQNRRTERKRRSTANPQFVYGSTMEQAVKRKKTSYLIGTNGVLMEDLIFEPAFEERPQPPPNSFCLVCSSAKGVLNLCVSCQRAFHWSCVSEAPTPPPLVGPLYCHACKLESNSQCDTENNGWSLQNPIAT